MGVTTAIGFVVGIVFALLHISTLPCKPYLCPRLMSSVPHQRTTSLAYLRTSATSVTLFFCGGQRQDHILFYLVECVQVGHIWLSSLLPFSKPLAEFPKGFLVLSLEGCISLRPIQIRLFGEYLREVIQRAYKDIVGSLLIIDMVQLHAFLSIYA